MTLQHYKSVELYISYRMSRLEISKATAYKMRSTLLTFAHWCDHTQQIDITEDILPTYSAYLMARLGSYTNTKKHMPTIKKFIAWCLQNETGTLRNT